MTTEVFGSALHSLEVSVYVQCGRQSSFVYAVTNGDRSCTWDVKTQSGRISGTGVINSALHCHGLSNPCIAIDHNIWFLCPVFTKEMYKIIGEN